MKNHAFTQNKTHSRMFLSGISTLEKTKADETPDRNTRGWTHVEAFTNTSSSRSVSMRDIKSFSSGLYSALQACGVTRPTGHCARGFTLIELLVVVLIIGILAAVALPQYQKAVWKSRNTQLKILTKSVWDAEVAYFLANNEYATRFDELDINLPLEAPTVSVENVAPCEIRVASADSVRQGNNYQIILNATRSSNVSITALYTDGPYKCQGFSLSSSHGFTCREKPMKNFSFGDFCPKLENATVIVGGGGSTSSWANYQMP